MGETQKRFITALLPVAGLMLVLLTACTNQTSPISETMTSLQTQLPPQVESLCAEVESGWGQDWARVVAALEILTDREHDCNGQSSRDKLYAARFNYGATLEAAGDTENAILLYQAALSVRPEGVEAIQALLLLDADVPAPPLPTCDTIPTLPAYTPARSDFITIQGDTFRLGEEAFTLRGVNYYPVRAPWNRFLRETTLETVSAEFDLIRAAGFNTLRIFLAYDALFTCAARGAVPIPEAFALLDGVIAQAAARDLRLIVTLHDLPDLLFYPLYDNPAHTAAQTDFIVRRYRDEAAILAWDVRNEGDIDVDRLGLSRSAVLDWLEITTTRIRSLDPNHPLTAGWLNNAAETLPYVDFVSFHFWIHPQLLAEQIQDLQFATDKPIVVEEFGYSTWFVPEALQADLLLTGAQISEEAGAAGWLVWTAFDFPPDVTCQPPDCPSVEGDQHHFGLWRTDYTPKPALDALIRWMQGEG